MRNGDNMRNFLLDTSGNAGEVSKKIGSILSDIVGPIMIALGGALAVYMIVLGVQYAKSENDNKRAEAKTRLVNCLIGLIVIIVMVIICMAVNWETLVNQLYNYF